MRDIIKDFIKLNQSAALFPLRAARKLLDDRNTGTKQMIDVAEDVVSAPFVVAEKMVDSFCRSCPGNAARSTRRSAGAGPNLRNIWVDPNVEVISDAEVMPGERRAELTVTGLLCGG